MYRQLAVMDLPFLFLRFTNSESSSNFRKNKKLENRKKKKGRIMTVNVELCCSSAIPRTLNELRNNLQGVIVEYYKGGFGGPLLYKESHFFVLRRVLKQKAFQPNVVRIRAV